MNKKYKCTKPIRRIPLGAVVDVSFAVDMTIYICYKGLTTVTNYATLRAHFEEYNNDK